jgi:hypothetical protein
LRREGRMFPVTCGDYARVLIYFAREAAGASGTRLSLRPLIFEGGPHNSSGAIRVARTSFAVR